MRLCLLALPLVAAFPSFREQLPNGRRVACPDGPVGEGCKDGNTAAGQPASVCDGVGHRTCAGETMPLNDFGKDMLAHEYTWTRELCETDSDGDGMTNGEELGDPCCLWEAYDLPSDYMTNFVATHPGVANNASDYVRPECSTTAPKKKAQKMNQFNPWEERRSVEMFIDNYSIPSDRTTYVDIAVNFPDDSEDLFHVVFAETILVNKKNLHHYVLKACPEKWPEEKNGKPVSYEESQDCRAQWAAWAPGKDIVQTPSWLGLPIGKAAGVVAFVVGVHYDNPDEETGRVSNDGVRIYYTPTLRNDSISEMSVMEVSSNPQMYIAPDKERFFLTRSCTLNVTDPDGQPAALSLSAMGYHAHLLGTEMYSEYTPVGASSPIDLGSEKVWHFDDQYQKNLLDMDIKLQTGDHIQSTCVFDSRGHRKSTVFGLETSDEMCWARYMGWPGNVTATCSGHLWTGELDPDESGLGLAARHPEINAPNVFDGADIRTGGLMIQGTIPIECSDNPYMTEICPLFMQTALSAEESENVTSICNQDVGEYVAAMFSGYGDWVEMLNGRTLISLCCTMACEDLCMDHELCIAEAGYKDMAASSTTSLELDGSSSDTDSSSGATGRNVLSFASLALELLLLSKVLTFFQ
mmetsp:Transcript_39777/g.71540  ORF Transcript_39777/g.71540 Transcript_39777/m.71540 type:complete len:636 (+) Transcript_39777:91-1998(+)